MVFVRRSTITFRYVRYAWALLFNYFLVCCARWEKRIDQTTDCALYTQSLERACANVFFFVLHAPCFERVRFSKPFAGFHRPYRLWLLLYARARKHTHTETATGKHSNSAYAHSLVPQAKQNKQSHIQRHVVGKRFTEDYDDHARCERILAFKTNE